MKGQPVPTRTDGDHDIWRMIPPEEKFALMARAQSRGVFAAAIGILIGCTLAVALQMGWIMWFMIVCSPFIFQIAAGKAWRRLRPKAMLEYLAARSASRRYAFAAKARDLSPRVMLRGHLEQIYEDERVQEALEAMIENTKEAEVWITLFGDAVVMVTERPGGAELKLSSLLDDKLEVTSRSLDGRDYSASKEVFLTLVNRKGENKKYKLTSPFPAALVVFEKKLKAQQNQFIPSFEPLAQITDPLDSSSSDVDEDKFNSLFSFS